MWRYAPPRQSMGGHLFGRSVGTRRRDHRLWSSTWSSLQRLSPRGERAFSPWTMGSVMRAGESEKEASPQFAFFRALSLRWRAAVAAWRTYAWRASASYASRPERPLKAPTFMLPSAQQSAQAWDWEQACERLGARTCDSLGWVRQARQGRGRTAIHHRVRLVRLGHADVRTDILKHG